MVIIADRKGFKAGLLQDVYAILRSGLDARKSGVVCALLQQSASIDVEFGARERTFVTDAQQCCERVDAGLEADRSVVYVLWQLIDADWSVDNIADGYCKTVSKAIATTETALVSLLYCGEARQMKRRGGSDSNGQRRSAFAETPARGWARRRTSEVRGCRVAWRGVRSRGRWLDFWCLCG